MTTSRPAAATQMRARVSQAMHPKVFFYARCTSCLFPDLETGLEYASMHTMSSWKT